MMKRKSFLGILLAIIESFVYVFFYQILSTNNIQIPQALLLYLIYMFIFGHYAMNDGLIWDEIKICGKAVFTYMITFTIIVPSSSLPTRRRWLIMLGIIMFFFSVFLSRTLRILARKFVAKRTMVLGTGYDALRYVSVAKRNRFAMTLVTGIVDLNNNCRFPEKFENLIPPNQKVFDSFPVINYNTFLEAVNKHQVDQVVVIAPELRPTSLDLIMKEIDEKVPSIKYSTQGDSLTNFSSQVQDLDGILLISTSRDEMHWYDRFIKRIIDIAAGIVGSIITLPLMLFIKIAYLRDGDKAPIIFKQTRIGLNGKPITIHKFRTMVPDAEAKLEELMRQNPAIQEEYKKNKKLVNDPRVTRIGKFLRHSSIDEFPQFFDVLAGRMSLIGPRPYLPKEKEDMSYFYKSIIKMKPGITGMWQANGRSNLSFLDRCKLDLYYYKNWSLWLDIVIIIKTVKATIYGKGAI